MEAEACPLVTAAQAGLTPSFMLTLQTGKLRLKEAMCQRCSVSSFWSFSLIPLSWGGVLGQRGSRQLVGELGSMP